MNFFQNFEVPQWVLDIDVQTWISVAAPILTWFIILINATRIAKRNEFRSTCDHLVTSISKFSDIAAEIWISGTAISYGRQEHLLSQLARLEIYSRIISLDSNKKFICSVSELRDWITLDIEDIETTSEPDREAHVSGILTSCEDAISTIENHYLKRYEDPLAKVFSPLKRLFKKLVSLILRFPNLLQYEMKLSIRKKT